MNDPFLQDGGCKTNKVIKFFKKNQVNEFSRVKIIVILNSHDVKVIFIVFFAKM